MPPARTRPDPQVVIQIDNLTFCWQADAPPVLDIETLGVERGEHLFIAGPSGSGKSTLLSLLAGVTTPTTGSVAVLDTPLQDLGQAQRDHFRANHLGYIFQMFNLIPYLSVIENVVLPCRFSHSRKARAVARSGSLRDEAMRLLGDLDMADAGLLDRPVNRLSVGQQQRVAAARSLIGSPEIIIADEPTSSLDASRRSAFVELLFEECRASDTTLILVSHDQALAGLFSRAIDLAELNRATSAPAEA